METKDVKKHAETLCYEYEMFRVACHTAIRLEGTRRPSVEQEWTRRAMLECTLLHARNLYDFLTNNNPSGKEDNLLAKDIIEDYEPRPMAMKHVRRNRRRIHKLLAHVSKSRPNLDRIWRLDLFMKELTVEWAHFRAVLERKHPAFHQIFVDQTNAIEFRLPDAGIPVLPIESTTETTEEVEIPVKGRT